MKSYLVLTPPGNTDPHHRRTLILRDGFAWLALLFPWIWLAWYRLWLAAVVVFLLQGVAGYLMQVPQFTLAGGLLQVAISLLVALEGRHYRAEMLIRKGWTLDKIIAAPDLDAAEDLFFAGLPTVAATTLPATHDWANRQPPAKTGAADTGLSSLSLFDHGGRR